MKRSRRRRQDDGFDPFGFLTSMVAGIVGDSPTTDGVPIVIAPSTTPLVATTPPLVAGTTTPRPPRPPPTTLATSTPPVVTVSSQNSDPTDTPTSSDILTSSSSPPPSPTTSRPRATPITSDVTSSTDTPTPAASSSSSINIATLSPSTSTTVAVVSASTSSSSTPSPSSTLPIGAGSAFSGPSASGSGPSGGAIAGITFGVLAGLGTLAFAILWAMRRRRRSIQENIGDATFLDAGLFTLPSRPPSPQEESPRGGLSRARSRSIPLSFSGPPRHTSKNSGASQMHPFDRYMADRKAEEIREQTERNDARPLQREEMADIARAIEWATAPAPAPPQSQYSQYPASVYPTSAYSHPYSADYQEQPQQYQQSQPSPSVSASRGAPYARSSYRPESLRSGYYLNNAQPPASPRWTAR